MGVTQYIGSRYVPVFADPADWNSTRTYEPLTIVMHEGNSYTSAQYVPKGVDISNEDFWKLTGNYNAQVEQYRKDVLAFDGRITANSDAISSETNRATTAEQKNADAISSETNRATAAEQKNADAISSETNRATAAEQKNAQNIATLNAQMDGTENSGLKDMIITGDAYNIAIIGDSYTEDPTNYFNELRSILPQNIIIDRYAKSATGFVRETAYGNKTNIPNRLDEIFNSGKTYNMVIMYAGINDYSSETQPYSSENLWGYIAYNQEEAAIKETVDKLRNSDTTKTAQLIFLPNSKPLSKVTTDYAQPANDWNYWYRSLINAVKGYKELQVITNSITWLYFVGNEFKFDNGYKDDNTHPNQNGAMVIAANIASIINGTFTEVPWFNNLYEMNVHFTINNEDVTFVRETVANFDGHTLTIKTTLESDHTFESQYSGSFDITDLIKYTANVSYGTTVDIIPFKNGNYPTYISAYYDNNKLNMEISIPQEKPSGTVIRFIVFQRISLY